MKALPRIVFKKAFRSLISEDNLQRGAFEKAVVSVTPKKFLKKELL